MKAKIILGVLVAMALNANAIIEGENTSTNATTTSSAVLKVRGQVVDKITGEALVGVAVKIADKTTYTDFDGYFSTTVANQNTLSINANLISYGQTEVSIDSSCSESVKLELNPIKD